MIRLAHTPLLLACLALAPVGVNDDGDDPSPQEALLRKAEERAEKGKYKDALKAYQKVLQNKKVPEFVKARARARIVTLGAAATEAVQEAQGLPPAKVKRALQKLLRDLEGLDEAEARAEAALAELE